MCVPVEDDEEGDSFRIGWPGVPILENDDDAELEEELADDIDEDDDDDESDIETGLPGSDTAATATTTADTDGDAGAIEPINEEEVQGKVYDFVTPPLESCQKALEPSWGFVE